MTSPINFYIALALLDQVSSHLSGLPQPTPQHWWEEEVPRQTVALGSPDLPLDTSYRIANQASLFSSPPLPDSLLLPADIFNNEEETSADASPKVEVDDLIADALAGLVDSDLPVSSFAGDMVPVPKARMSPPRAAATPPTGLLGGELKEFALVQESVQRKQSKRASKAAAMPMGANLPEITGAEFGRSAVKREILSTRPVNRQAGMRWRGFSEPRHTGASDVILSTPLAQVDLQGRTNANQSLQKQPLRSNSLIVFANSATSQAEKANNTIEVAAAYLQLRNVFDFGSFDLGLMDAIGQVEWLIDNETGLPMKAMPTSNTSNTSRSVTGVHQNAVGDGKAFMLNLLINGLTISVCILFFCAARRSYTLVFQGNVYIGKVPCNPTTSFCGWINDSLNYSLMDLAEHVGLDAAMLLEYCNLCMKILFVIGLPLCLVEAPLNIFCGGNAAGLDHLSWQGMANVDDGREYLYWFYAALVWYVVAITQIFTFGSMKKFIKIRFDWIRVVPPPQAQTVLVEHIPKEIRTDKKLTRYFNNVFGEKVVVRATVVKHVDDIRPLMEELRVEKRHLKEALLRLEKTGMRPQVGGDGQADSIDHRSQRINTLEAQIAMRRGQLNNLADSEDFNSDVCSSSAFVIFNSITHAASALAFNYTEDGDEFVVSVPPQPNDVIYEGLTVSPLRHKIKEVIGYALITVLFFLFLPVILFISMVTEIGTIEQMLPFMRTAVTSAPIIGIIWDAMFGSIAVTVMMSFLPTFLMLIFYNCFSLKSSVEAQHMCQKYYFVFLVTFVLLITSVGASLISTMDEIIHSPLLIFSILASNMPSASHYYLSWVATQWTTHAMDLTRYMNWIKYIIYKFSNGDAHYAKEMSEPEDQDFYGIGARSARFTLIMITCLCFCTLSPLIVILGFINFALCRVVFGYLIAYSEVPKPVIGGHFFATQLKHTQVGLFIYVILMTGVLFQRAPNTYPSIIACSAFVPLIWSWMKFERRFRWEALPAEYCRDSEEGYNVDPRVYVQPELSEPLKGPQILSRNMMESKSDASEKQSGGFSGILRSLSCHGPCSSKGAQSDGQMSLEGSQASFIGNYATQYDSVPGQSGVAFQSDNSAQGAS